MIKPLYDTRGRPVGFIGGESYYDRKGKQIGKVIGAEVVTMHGSFLGEVDGNVLIAPKAGNPLARLLSKFSKRTDEPLASSKHS